MKNLFKRFTGWIGLAGAREEKRPYRLHDDEWDLLRKIIRGVDREPSPSEILEAYFKSFTFSQGRWHVGNHQLWEGFTERDARTVSIQLHVATGMHIPILPGSRIEGDAENFKGVLAAGGVVLNKGIPFERRRETMNNFIEQLEIEYDKNINIIMAASDSRLSSGDME